MNRGALMVALLAASLLAGCVASGTQDGLPAETVVTDPSCASDGTGCQSGTRPPATTNDNHGDRMTIQGTVVDEALHPITNATVRLHELDRTVTVGAGGTYVFTDLVPSTYFLTATAPEHIAKTLSIESKDAGQGLHFVLERLAQNVSHNVTVKFQGHFECALEVLIISPSCDSLLTDPRVGGPRLFNSTNAATFGVEGNWKTVVIDVVFEPQDQPGLDGMRVVAQNPLNQSSLGTYVQYGRFNGSESYTIRLEPGGIYEEGVAPVPLNATTFRVVAYPHSHGWHEVCVPTYSCTLGVGVGLDVEFHLYITTFYVEPAPEGWTLRGQ